MAVVLSELSKYFLHHFTCAAVLEENCRKFNSIVQYNSHIYVIEILGCFKIYIKVTIFQFLSGSPSIQSSFQTLST